MKGLQSLKNFVLDKWIELGSMFILSFFIFFPKIIKSILFCPFHRYLGIECPGCGLTRSLVNFYQGKLTESFFLNPVGILLGVLFLVWPIGVFFNNKRWDKFKFNTQNLVAYSLLFVGVFRIFNGIIKIF